MREQARVSKPLLPLLNSGLRRWRPQLRGHLLPQTKSKNKISHNNSLINNNNREGSLSRYLLHLLLPRRWTTPRLRALAPCNLPPCQASIKSVASRLALSSFSKLQLWMGTRCSNYIRSRSYSPSLGSRLSRSSTSLHLLSSWPSSKCILASPSTTCRSWSVSKCSRLLRTKCSRCQLCLDKWAYLSSSPSSRTTSQCPSRSARAPNLSRCFNRGRRPTSWAKQTTII